MAPGGARLGAARGREGEQPIGPGDQTVDMHKPGCGVAGGRSQACQPRVLELARAAAARGHQGQEFGVRVIPALAHLGPGRGEVGNGGTRPPRCRQ